MAPPRIRQRLRERLFRMPWRGELFERSQMTFDDKPTVIPAPLDPFENAPTLHFSNDRPITKDDLKKAAAGRSKERPRIGWEAQRDPVE